MSTAVMQLGALGVFLLMIPESACVPIPSELTLMSAGFGVHQGWLSLPIAVVAATAGNVAGSTIAYWLGRQGLLGRLPPAAATAVARCERLFARRGDGTVFIARLLPLARTFVSLPAGHVRVPYWRFVFMTIAGCAIWSTAFILIGDLVGTGWRHAASTTGRVTLALTALTLIVATAIGRRRTPRRSRSPTGSPGPPR